MRDLLFITDHRDCAWEKLNYGKIGTLLSLPV